MNPEAQKLSQVLKTAHCVPVWAYKLCLT